MQTWTRIGLSFGAWCALTISTFAVVIPTGDGAGNTTAPADDPGFANVGERGVGSAIYLGNRWVLTASHVNPGPVTFGGIEYPNLIEETVKLPNPPELDLNSATADLLLLRLEEAPPLPAVHLPCEAITLGSEVLMIGRGRDRQAEESFWKVTFQSGDGNDTWKPLDSSSGSNKSGYRTVSSQSIRWGRNQVALTEMETNSGFGDVRSFSTSFSKSIPVEDVAQGVRGDSGGAVFQKNDSVWELVGMMHAVGLEEQQPGSTTSAIFGQETFVADLFAYRDVLREYADFEPARGDLDGDGKFTATDIDRLHLALRESQESCHFDLNEDLEVDIADRDELLYLAGALGGDTNLDGRVSFEDFLALSVEFNQAGGWASGDFDGDGQILFEDFLVLSRNFGKSFEGMGEVETTSAARSAAAVPEPAAASLLIAGLVAALHFYRRRPLPHLYR